jgi:acyl-CoA thioesterase-1
LSDEIRSAARAPGGYPLNRRTLLLSFAAFWAAPDPFNAMAAPDLCKAPDVYLPSAGRLERTRAHLKSRRPIRILAIGSSSTQGVGASSPAAAYPAQLEVALAMRFPGQQIIVVNAGIAGETADLTVARLDAELAHSKPDLVLWQVGTNDAMTASVSETGFVSAVEQGVKSIEQHGCDVIIIDQQFFKKAENPARYERFVSILERVARERRLDLFSRNRLMKYWERSLTGGVAAMLNKDGFHMNDRGYACVAELLANHIKESASASSE